MQLVQIELIERTTLSIVVQLIADYTNEALHILREATDEPQDIAEDVMREAV